MTCAPCAVSVTWKSSVRITEQEAFVLHRYPHGETSFIVELFAREHGRVGAMAKGARRSGSDYRALLSPFQPLLVNWSGRGELVTLAGAEAAGSAAALAGEGLLCGFYLNELLLRLIPRHDANEALFDAYGLALQGLAGARREAVLRVFEKRLLQELGYGLILECDQAGTPIDPSMYYVYAPEQGPRAASERETGAVRGETLIALARDELTEPRTLQEAKQLLRAMLAPHMGDRPLRTRELFRTIKHFSDGL